MPTILLANRTEQGSLATPTNTENCDLSYNIDKNKIESIHFKTSSNYKFFYDHVESNSMQIQQQQQQPSKQANENIKSMQLPLLGHLSYIYAIDDINTTIC
jgi:hypothetical protein